ncbi:MAG: thioredoxin family protein [Dissulfurispiraceae bacterium]|jgi:thioredoxin 1|nr:thioredoxin family protein [Dissulfurispiraceae bacterium]
MKKIFCAVLLLILITACSSKTPKTVEEQIELSKKSGRILLVQIGNDVCGPCIEMKPTLQRVQEDYQDKIQIIYVDTVKEPELIKKYGIQKIPTQIFYDKKGKEFGRNEGHYSYPEIAFVLKDMGIKLF